MMKFNPPPNWPPLPKDFTPPPGWRPDPRWGEPPVGWPLWLEDPSAPSSNSAAWATAGALILAAIGLVVGFQPVSLLSGTGLLYVGLAMCAGAAVLAWVMKPRTWVRVLAIVAVVLVGANIAYSEAALHQKRQQLENALSGLGGNSEATAPAVPVAPVVPTPTQVDEDTAYPPALDIKVGTCTIDSYTHWPSCQLMITNHSTRTCDYVVTLSAVSADDTEKYTDMTAYVNGLEPGQSSPQTAQGLGQVPADAKVKLGNVQRYPSP